MLNEQAVFLGKFENYPKTTQIFLGVKKRVVLGKLFILIEVLTMRSLYLH